MEAKIYDLDAVRTGLASGRWKRASKDIDDLSVKPHFTVCAECKYLRQEYKNGQKVEASAEKIAVMPDHIRKNLICISEEAELPPERDPVSGEIYYYSVNMLGEEVQRADPHPYAASINVEGHCPFFEPKV